MIGAPVTLAMAMLCAGCSGGAATPAATGTQQVVTPASACDMGGTKLASSGLCPAQAEKLIAEAPAPAAMEGCKWVLRDTPFATDVLLYRALDCDSETRLEVQIGNHMTTINPVPDSTQASDPNLEDVDLPRVAAVFAGDPDGRSRALFETRDSMQNPEAAARCDIRAPYDGEGLPQDALIVDIRRSKADLQRDDAVPQCGTFGYNPAGGSIDFWRPHQGYAWFFSMETGVWNVDPASFTLITKTANGNWQRVPDPS